MANQQQNPFGSGIPTCLMECMFADYEILFHEILEPTEKKARVRVIS